MKKALFTSILTAVVCVSAWPARPSAQSGIAWQSTFNCAEWSQSMGLPTSIVNCNGIGGAGGWTTTNHPAGDQITLAANFSGGGGGRGFRHWRGSGVNNNGGGIEIDFGSNLPELWLRWYSRYQAGFAWNTMRYAKDLYFNEGGQVPVGIAGFNSGMASYNGVNPSWTGSSSGSWTSIMRGSVGDGQWHSFEVHLKRGTSASNGVVQYWIDGVLVQNQSDRDNTTTGGWRSVMVGGNQSDVNAPPGTEFYTDYDDFALSTTGHIGPLGSPPPPPPPVTPTTPANLRVAP